MIELYNVSKTYLMGDEVIRVLDGVSLKIGEGAFVSVRGKSGSGKSTLLHLIGGLDDTDTGRVVIDGNNISEMEEKKLCVFRRKNIGFVFQFFNLLPELTLAENILFPAKIDGKKYDKDYYNYLIEKTELGDRLNHLPSQTSGGQQQRAAIARAMILKPKILLLDEPTGNLDSESSEAVMKSICDIKTETEQTIVLVTHDDEVASAADYEIVIKDGALYHE